jgi:hypothetical protein
MLRSFGSCALALLLAFAVAPMAPAYAEAPEQLDQLEPEGGEWQAEYYGQFGSTDGNERQHSLEIYYGVSDSLAIGVEVEAEAEDGDFGFGEAGISALYKFNDPEEAPLGLGVLLSARLDDEATLSEAEARFIAEKKSDTWWGQANVMLRHVNEDDEKGELLAYGWNLSHSVTDQFWLGVEGSGQIAKLGGFDLGFDKAHFIGPAAMLELEVAEDKEVEIGFAWFRRLSDESPRNTARFFVQFDF